MTDVKVVSVKLNADVEKAVTDLTKAVEKITKLVKKMDKASKATKKTSKDFKTGVDQMSKSSDDLEKKLSGVSRKFTSLSESARKLSMSFGAAFSGIAAAGIAVTRVSSEFETGMVRAASVAAGSSLAFDDAFSSMSKQAIKTANTTVFSAKEVAGAMEFMAMAGFNASEVIATVGEVAKLSAAANITMAESGNILTNIMSSFGVTATNTRRELESSTGAMVTQEQVVDKLGQKLADVNNLLIGVFTNSNVNILQLGESFKIAGAVASNADVSMKELAVSVGLLGNVGIQGTLAGTGLKRAISAIVKPTKQSAKAMSRLGLTTEVLREDFAGQTKGMLRVVTILEKMKKKYESAGKSVAFVADIMEVFGERAGPIMSSLIKQGSEAMVDLGISVERAKFEKIADFLEEMQRKTTAGQLKLLKSNVDSLAISLGELLLPRINDVVSSLKEMAKEITENRSATIRAIANYGELALAITGIVTAASLAVFALGLLSGAISNIGALLAGLGLGWAVVGAAMSKVIFILVSLGTVFLTAFGVTDQLVGALGMANSELLDMDLAAENASYGVGSLADQMLAFVGVWDQMTIDRQNRKISESMDLFGKLGTEINAVTNDIKALDSLNIGSKIFIKNVSLGVGDKEFGLGKNLQETTRILEDMFSELARGGSAFRNAFNVEDVKFFTEFLERSAKEVKSLSKELDEITKTGGSIQRADKIRERLSTIKDEVQTARESVQTAFEGLIKDLSKVSVNIDKSGLTPVQIERAEELKTKLESLFGVFKEFAKSKGGQQAEALLNSIDDLDKSLSLLEVSATRATEIVEDNAEKIKDAWSRFFNWLDKKISSQVSSLLSGADPLARARIESRDVAQKGIEEALTEIGRVMEKEGIKSADQFRKGLMGRGGAKDLAASFSLLSFQTLKAAAAHVKAKDGAILFDREASDAVMSLAHSTQLSVDQIEKLSLQYTGLSNELGDVTDHLKMFALSQENLTEKIDKSASKLDKLNEAYDKGIESFKERGAAIQRGIDVKLSSTPELTSIFQERDQSLDEIGKQAEALKEIVSQRALEQINFERLNASLDVQEKANVFLASSMASLSVAVRDNTRAIRKQDPIPGAEGGGAQMDPQLAFVAYQAAVRKANSSISEKTQSIWEEVDAQKAVIESIRDGNIGLQNFSSSIDAIAELEAAGTVEEIRQKFNAIAKDGKTIGDIPDVPFSKINAEVEKDLVSLADIITGEIGNLFNRMLKVTPKGSTAFGLDVSDKTMQKIVNAKQVGASLLSSLGSSSFGQTLGQGIGFVIGSFSGNPAVGAQIGKAVGTVIEASVGFVVKSITKVYESIAKFAEKASMFVPEQRFQSAVSDASKIFAPIATAITLVGTLMAAVLVPAIWTTVLALGSLAIAALFGSAATGQWYVWVVVAAAAIASLVAAIGMFVATIIPAIAFAAGAAMASFLLALGAQEMRFNRVVGSALDEDAGITELDENFRTPFTRITDALAASIDRIVYAMGPFYENLFVLVGLFDMFMETFVVLADELGAVSSIGPDMLDLFKGLALGLISAITAVAQFHNIMVSLPSTLINFEAAIWEFMGKALDMIGADVHASSYLENARTLRGLADAYDESISGLIIDTDRLQEVFERIQNAGRADFMDRFRLLDRAAAADIRGASDSAKEFGEELTNVPTGFKVALHRFNAMDAVGGDAGASGGPSIMDIGANEYFNRFESAVESGVSSAFGGTSVGSFRDGVEKLAESVNPAGWEDAFANPLNRLDSSMREAFDALTNTLSVAFLGPEEAFSGATSPGAGAMSGRGAVDSKLSAGSSYIINIGEMSIDDASNPEQLANMIANKSARDHMAQGGTPFPTTKSGSNWWNGGGGRGF